ncbi:CHASE sensor domain-containing protein [Candidatus Albibeggiatoa sp. nov. BB20]|uniref:nSTAND1 domain-containing NTPase n=1 Tax=Candidatus Albibeggiatoa sp. nov. BB20 TaxID=3162723 RepID=UPI0033656FB7
MSIAPYPGLRPFERDETDIFFGREEHVDQLIARLGETHFLAVVGTSGCGKSSLVRTGLLPNLEAGFLASANGQWHIAELRPSNQPMARLAQALHQSVFEQDEAVLQAQLWRGEYSLHELLQQSPLEEGANILLVVDQFEEIFRYYQQGDKNEAASFVKLLLGSSQHPQVYVVMTMRSDFLGDCATFYGLPEAVNHGLYLTPRLTREQLSEAIAFPASVFGGEIEPTLLNQLLNDATYQQDQLPVIQHALMQMWWLACEENTEHTVITTVHYEQIGGLQNALSEHIDSVYFGLNAKQQRIAKVLFIQLTERFDIQRDTRRPMRLSAIAAQADVDWQAVAEVVDIFRGQGRHFVMPPLGRDLTPDSVIDISHESLIRQWQQLKEWIEEETESAKLYSRLEDAAQRWKKGNAALWRNPDLKQAVDWKKDKQPTKQWASRYGDDFDFVMDFLTASEIEEKNEIKIKKRRKQSTLFIGVIFVILCLAFLWQVNQEKLNQKNNTESFISQITAIGRLMGENSSGALLFYDASSAEENLKALIAQKYFYRANLFTRDRNIFATKKHDEIHEESDSLLVSQYSNLLYFIIGEYPPIIMPLDSITPRVPFFEINLLSDSNNTKAIYMIHIQKIIFDKEFIGILTLEYLINDTEPLFEAFKNYYHLNEDKPAYVHKQHKKLAPYIRGVNHILLGNIDKATKWLKGIDREKPRELANAIYARQVLLGNGNGLAFEGKIKLAIDKYKQALHIDSTLSFNPETRAKEVYAQTLTSEGHKLARNGELKEAINTYQSALKLDTKLSFNATLKANQIYADVLLDESGDLASDGYIAEAIDTYHEALFLNPKLKTNMSIFNTFCWYGNLYNQSNKTIEFCNQIVVSNPKDVGYRLNRGISRALLGDTKEAIEDISFYQTQRLDFQWLNILKQGQNPFTSEVIKTLASDRQNDRCYWR